MGGANTGRSGLGKEGSYAKIKSWARKCGKTEEMYKKHTVRAGRKKRNVKITEHVRSSGWG